MNNKIIATIAAAAACLGLFLPIITGGIVYVNLHHLGGLCLALYATVPALLILAILRQTTPAEGIKGWIVGLGALNVLVAIYAFIGGQGLVQMFSGMGGEGAAPAHIAPGSGLMLIVAGAVVAALVTFVDAPAEAGSTPATPAAPAPDKPEGNATAEECEALLGSDQVGREGCR